MATQTANKFDEKSVIKTSDKSAVFLTNGQVYFGDITKTSDEYIVLPDIYYLAEEGANLTKLGCEAHSPQDVMYIYKNQVLFWENLRSDGNVSKAIAQYKKDHKADYNTCKQ